MKQWASRPETSVRRETEMGETIETESTAADGTVLVTEGQAVRGETTYYLLNIYLHQKKREVIFCFAYCTSCILYLTQVFQPASILP